MSSNTILDSYFYNSVIRQLSSEHDTCFRSFYISLCVCVCVLLCLFFHISSVIIKQTLKHTQESQSKHSLNPYIEVCLTKLIAYIALVIAIFYIIVIAQHFSCRLDICEFSALQQHDFTMHVSFRV